MAIYLVFLAVLAFATAIPTPSPVIRKLDPSYPRYQYAWAADGIRLVDLWGTAEDLQAAARFDPDRENVYHLFTRLNPQVSQPILMGSDNLLGHTNYNPQRRTIILVHGWVDSVTGDYVSVMVPAFLAAEDVNVIVVDWSAGAGHPNYFVAVTNTVTSGEGVARFINWLNAATGASPADYHLVGHSLGGHQVGIIGRNLNGNASYITSLDPAFPGWITNNNKFRPTDGAYTEAMHTNVGLAGYIAPLAHADFYPNGGITQPGCNSQACDHDRCFYFMAESLISGGFTGRRCANYPSAIVGACSLPESLHMGGLVPKTGSSGIFYLETNAAPPFSRG